MSNSPVIAEKPSVAVARCRDRASENKTGYWQGGGVWSADCIGIWCPLPRLASTTKNGKWRYEDLPILPQPWQFIVPGRKENSSLKFALFFHSPWMWTV